MLGAWLPAMHGTTRGLHHRTLFCTSHLCFTLQARQETIIDLETPIHHGTSTTSEHNSHNDPILSDRNTQERATHLSRCHGLIHSEQIVFFRPHLDRRPRLNPLADVRGFVSVFFTWEHKRSSSTVRVHTSTYATDAPPIATVKAGRDILNIHGEHVHTNLDEMIKATATKPPSPSLCGRCQTLYVHRTLPDDA